MIWEDFTISGSRGGAGREGKEREGGHEFAPQGQERTPWQSTASKAGTWPLLHPKPCSHGN